MSGWARRIGVVEQDCSSTGDCLHPQNPGQSTPPHSGSSSLSAGLWHSWPPGEEKGKGPWGRRTMQKKQNFAYTDFHMFVLHSADLVNSLTHARMHGQRTTPNILLREYPVHGKFMAGTRGPLGLVGGIYRKQKPGRVVLGGFRKTLFRLPWKSVAQWGYP